MSEYITIPLSKKGKHAGQYIAIVSLEDTDLAELNWFIKFGVRSQANYALRKDANTTISMHREVMRRALERDLLSSEHVDHINGDGLDNRRENLRLATHAQNMRNSTSLANKTGYKGVHKAKHNKYTSQIYVNRKRITLGYFDTPEDAHKAYCEAATKYFGEFARFE